MATYTIFAYGSLINKASLRKTVPEARNIIPAKVYGLQRVFNLASRHRYDDVCKEPICVLNAESANAADAMNGTCFEMDQGSLKDLLQREKGYEFCQITARHYFDEDVVMDANYFRAKLFTPYQFLVNSKQQRHYLELCVTGSKIYGQDFVDHFKKSTSFWGIDSTVTHQTIWQGDY